MSQIIMQEILFLQKIRFWITYLLCEQNGLYGWYSISCWKSAMWSMLRDWNSKLTGRKFLLKLHDEVLKKI